MKNPIAKITTLSCALFAFTATAQVQYSNEFWISTNATGNFYPTNGTLDSPLDGSSQANFDANMVSLPANSTIHFLPGTYRTFGDENWVVKTGQKLVGSGIDQTIIQLATNAPEEGDGTYTVGSQGMLNADYLPVTNVVVSDMTVDCNWTPANGDITRNGVGLDGTENSVRRVKVKNESYGTESSEAWGIAIDNSGALFDSVGNVIEECEVDPLVYGHSISALSFNGGPTNNVSGIIKDNKEFLSADPGGAQLAINGNWDHNVIIEGNYVDGADNAVYEDTGGCTNMIISHNIFKNCYVAVNYYGWGDKANITIDFNNISLTSPSTAPAFNFWSGVSPGYGVVTNVLIFGNTLDLYAQGVTSTYAVAADTNLVGLTFANNTVDPLIGDNQATTTYFTPGGNVHMYNNYDLYGNYVDSLNIPELGGEQVSSLGLSLISSTEASSALTNLGLPSVPSTIVTNDATANLANLTVTGNASVQQNIYDNSETATNSLLAGPPQSGQPAALQVNPANNGWIELQPQGGDNLSPGNGNIYFSVPGGGGMNIVCRDTTGNNFESMHFQNAGTGPQILGQAFFFTDPSGNLIAAMNTNDTVAIGPHGGIWTQGTNSVHWTSNGITNTLDENLEVFNAMDANSDFRFTNFNTGFNYVIGGGPGGNSQQCYILQPGDALIDAAGQFSCKTNRAF